MKQLLLVLAALLLLDFGLAPKQAEAQVSVNLPFLSVDVGNTFGNRFLSLRNRSLAFRQQQAFLQQQALLAQAQQAQAFQRQQDFLLAQQLARQNTRNFQAQLAQQRQLQQFNALANVRGFHNPAFFDPRAALLQQNQFLGKNRLSRSQLQRLRGCR